MAEGDSEWGILLEEYIGYYERMGGGVAYCPSMF